MLMPSIMTAALIASMPFMPARQDPPQACSGDMTPNSVGTCSTPECTATWELE